LSFSDWITLVHVFVIVLSRFLFFLVDQLRIFLYKLQLRFLSGKNWSGLSDKIRVDGCWDKNYLSTKDSCVLDFLPGSFFFFRFMLESIFIISFTLITQKSKIICITKTYIQFHITYNKNKGITFTQVNKKKQPYS
jgi:hypothetical protein